MYYNAELCIKYYFWYLSIFYGSAIIIARGAKKEKNSLASSRCFMHYFLQSFCAIVGIWTLNENKRFISNFHLISNLMWYFNYITDLLYFVIALV